MDAADGDGVAGLAAADQHDELVGVDQQLVVDRMGAVEPMVENYLEAKYHVIWWKRSVWLSWLFLAEMLIKGARAVLIPDALYIYTTRVGDQSGVASPHSRSIPRFDLFADGISALKSKYSQTITADIDRAMELLLQRGLPTRTTATAEKGAPTQKGNRAQSSAAQEPSRAAPEGGSLR